MKKHLIDKDSYLDFCFSACGVPRAAIDPRHETREPKKVTCANCKRVIKKKKKDAA